MILIEVYHFKGYKVKVNFVQFYLNIMKHKLRFLFFLFLLCNQLSFSQTELKIAPGETYKVRTESNSSTHISMMGQDMETTQQENAISSLNIIEESDKYFTFFLRLDEVQSTVSQMGQEEDYDSTIEEDSLSPLAIAYKDRLHKEMLQKLDKAGKLVLPHKSKEEEEKDEKTESAEEMHNFSALFVKLPTEVAVNDSWVEEQKIESKGIDLEGKRTYTVKQVEGDQITLQVTGRLKMSQETLTEGMEVTSNLKGNISGEVLMNKTSSIIESDQSVMTMEGSTHTMDIEIPIRVRTITKTTVMKTKTE